MDERGAAGVAEQPGDAVRAVAHDDPRLAGIIARQRPRDHRPAGRDDLDRVAALEAALDRGDAGREQRLAAIERGDRAGVDHDAAAGLHAEDPALAGRARVAVGLEPRAGGALGERGQRPVDRALA